jgi:tripartite ATP-independent transporter DctM subunit
MTRLVAARLHRGEDLLISATLGAMVVVPIADALLRGIAGRGITAAPLIVQHLGLVAGMLGGAIAAREGRLLLLSTIGDSMLRGGAQATARAFAGAVGGLVTAFLAMASYTFVQTEQQFGKVLVYGVPVWAVEAALPIGFATIAARLLYRAADDWRGRFATLGVAIALGLPIVLMPGASTTLVGPALVTLAVATVLGTPAFVTLGGAALVLFWSNGTPIASIPVSHYSLVTNPTIPALPLFTLAGYVLAESGAPQRLVRVFNALCGRFRGGPAVVTVLVCTFFTAFTGGSGVTILALGGLLMPILIGARYSERSALGLVTGAGSLGMLLPPCLPLIVYGIVARIDIKQMFLGGLLPAVLMMLVTVWWGIRQGQAATASGGHFDAGETWAAAWDAKWELLTPVVAVAALFSGRATTVEAAALTALYTVIVACVLHHDLRVFRDMPRVLTECGLLVGGILLVLGIALGFTNYLVDAEVPARAVDWTVSAVHSKILFLILLNLFLVVVGCLMDVYSAIVVQVPLLVPLGAAYGIDPIQLAVIFLANMELGYLTPPVGLNVYMASYRFGKPVPAVFRAVLPMIIVLHVGVLLITFVPWLTTALPHWAAR